MAIGSSSRGGARVIWVCIHTAEGARTAASLRDYFARTGSASSHVTIDDDHTLELVPRSRAAWTLRNGNSRSVNAELCAFAGWTRAEWLSRGTVDGCANPRAIVSRAAAWARRECNALGIPKVKLSPADVRAGKAGIIGHHDYTLGARDGSHWDPGPNFPWDVFMAEVRRSGPSGEDDDMQWNTPRPNKDWAGKGQTLESSIDHIDEYSYKAARALTTMFPSRIPGDDNQTTMLDLVFDAGNWTNQTLRKVNQMEDEVAELRADIAAIKAAVVK